MSNKHQKYNPLILFAGTLNPKGIIASQQRDLIIFAVILMLVAVIPTLLLAYSFAWRYRSSNKNAKKYTPNWDRNPKLQFAWWALLCAIILVLAITAWNSSHALDPRKTLQSDIAPITIQAVALQWKWLFIYPEQNIASVNFLQIPEDTPIDFEITADAPMNSLWIPQLGGQMYAMNGMRTNLHLMANEIGNYRGYSTNISGEGFSKMNFIAKASSKNDFDAWIKSAENSSNILSFNEYNNLAKPEESEKILYSDVEDNLFGKILMKFMPVERTDGSRMEHEH